MQINPTTSPGIRVQGVPTTPARAPDKPRDRAVFSQTEALRRALDEVPDTRAEETLRARDLFTSVPYPPVEIIQRLSRLLAKEWPDPNA